MTMKFDGTPCCESYAEQLTHNHCCEWMTEHTHDPDLPLLYQPVFRRHIIPLRGLTAAFQQIFYCPWCGTKLPESLEDTYYEILQKEHGINPEFVLEHDRRIPQEFKSNEWWKKRRL